MPADEAREQLDDLILGRLRLASKGSMRVGEEGTLKEFSAAEQVTDGMYMIGQVATLRDAITDVASLHRSVTEDSLALLEDYQQAQLETAVEPGEPAAEGLAREHAEITRRALEFALAHTHGLSVLPGGTLIQV